MKIFFPVEVFYPSQAGGAANSVYWLAKNLAAHGFETTIVATDEGLKDQVPLNRWFDTDAGRTIFVKTKFYRAPVLQTLISLRHFWRADVVHLSSIFFPTAFITAFAARVLRKKIAWSPRGELTESSLSFSAGRKRAVLWLIRSFIGKYPLFHSTSDEENQSIRRVFGEDARIRQIPNYVELEPLSGRSNGNYLLYIGRIHPIKAIDNLVKSLRLSEAFLRSDMVLKIAGKGKPGYEEDLRRLVSELDLDEKVQFVGQVEGPEKLRLLADAKATILPSHTENFGVVVVESLAQGTPVIASTNTPWKALAKERIGFWTDNSPAEIAKTVDSILNTDDDEYQRYRARSRDFVVREFDIRNHIDEWVEFYSSFK